MQLTKSDFLLYLETPMHLWAKKHNLLERTAPSDFDQFIMLQGQKAEKLASQYFTEIFISTAKVDDTVSHQPVFVDGSFEAIADETLTIGATGKTDIYEIKSSTEVKKEHIYDATFQMLIIEKEKPVGHVYILHLNADYIYDGHYVFDQMFVIEDITDRCRAIADEVRGLREKALAEISQDDPSKVAHCYTPDKCPCPKLCHPNLPEHSIYTLPNLSKKKSDTLLEDGIIKISDIPEDFKLSPLQENHVRAVKENKAIIDFEAVKESLGKLTYPLYFLDYETCNLALPLYPNYHPQQQMVFQYSLHIVNEKGEMTHSEYLADRTGDPAIELVKKLRSDIGDHGSVIVWNKTFETGRNTELAKMYPEFSDFLLGVNERIYDLAEIVRKGYYIDPAFSGSWSIKKVLPVLMPNLSYKDLAIGKGDLAMITWWDMVNAGNSMLENVRSDIKEALLKYCERDTLAMVEIWKAVRRLF